MNEQITPGTELTPKALSSTLNTRSTMAEPGQPERTNPNTSRTEAHPQPMGGNEPRPTTIRELLAALLPNAPPDVRAQFEREGIRAAWGGYSDSLGRPLTPDEERMRDTGALPPIYGDADTPPHGPENGAHHNTQNPRGNGGAQGENNNPTFDGGQYFRDILGRVRYASPGDMGKQLLNSLFEEAVKRELPADDPQRVERRPAFNQEREQALNVIKQKNNELNPRRPETREEERKFRSADLRRLVEAAKLAGGGERLSSIDSPEAQAIIDYIGKINFGTEDHLAAAEYLALETADVMTDHVREILFEQIWELFIGRADKLPEDQHYRESLGGLEATSIFDRIKAMTDTAFVKEDGSNPFAYYLNELAHVRSNMHDLNASFRVGDEYKKAVVQQLSNKGLHFVQNELAGVNPAVALWEKYLGDKVRERKQWLSQGDIDLVEKSVRQTLDKMKDLGMLKKDGRILTTWEIARAVRMAKISMAGTQRLAMYAGYGNLPPESQGRIGSIPYEYVARAIFNFKMAAPRFYNGKASVEWMNNLFMYMTKDEKGKDNGKFLELFGCDQRFIAANSLGAFDMESHGWRSQLLFLNNILVDTPDGKKTLQEFLDSATLENQQEGKDVVFDGTAEVPQEKIEKFLDQTEDTILGQRLYLSVLSRLSLPTAEKGSPEAKRIKDLKMNIWKKIAILKPSTIMQLLPKEMLSVQDEKMLDDVKQKLFIAEMKRVADDTHEWASIAHGGHIPHSQNKEQIGYEVARFKKAIEGRNDSYKYQILTKADFTPEEGIFIKKMIDKGFEQAEKLSGAEFSQTLIIDDAPFIAWAKTGFADTEFGETGRSGMAPEDLVRWLLSDQGTTGESYNAFLPHVESPQTPALEAYATFVKGIAGVFGRKKAQSWIEVFGLSDVKMYSIYTKNMWTSVLDKALDLTRSPMEKHVRTSRIAWDEEGRQAFWTSLAQLGLISDSKIDSNGGPTQLDKLKKRTKSNTLWQRVRNTREGVQYLPLWLLSIFKSILSESAKAAFG